MIKSKSLIGDFRVLLFVLQLAPFFSLLQRSWFNAQDSIYPYTYCKLKPVNLLLLVCETQFLSSASSMSTSIILKYSQKFHSIISYLCVDGTIIFITYQCSCYRPTAFIIYLNADHVF